MRTLNYKRDAKPKFIVLYIPDFIGFFKQNHLPQTSETEGGSCLCIYRKCNVDNKCLRRQKTKTYAQAG